MTHLFGAHVVTAPNKYKLAVAQSITVRRISAGDFFPMSNSRDIEPILPTTNMAGGNNKNGKKRVLVVGAGAAGMIYTTFLGVAVAD